MQTADLIFVSISCEALLIWTDRKTWSTVDKPHISMPQCHTEVGTRLVR